MSGLQVVVTGQSFLMKIPRKALIFAVGLVAALICVTGGYLVWDKYIQPSRQTESQRVLAEVDKLYSLPKSESPTVARVQDVNKLSGQDFYKDARNGDYLLVYRKAKLALIYRESQNRIVRVGNINLDK